MYDQSCRVFVNHGRIEYLYVSMGKLALGKDI